MLFATLLSNIIQAVLMLAALGVCFFLFRRFGIKNAPSKSASKSKTPPTATPPDGGPTPDEIADDLAATLPDVSEAIEAGSSLEDQTTLEAAALTDVSEVFSDAASDAAEAVEETITIAEPFEEVAEIDDVLADTSSFTEQTTTDPFATSPQTSTPEPPPANELPPKRPSSAAPLPPIRPSASSTSAAPTFPSEAAPSTSSIPPRRDSGRDKRTPPAAPIVLSEPEPEEIEVLSDAATIGISAFSPGATESDSGELADLRLALEASHNELSHLTSQRDQAVSRAVQNEEELGRLRRQLHELGAAQESMQQDRQRASLLESELETLRSQLADTTNSSSAAEEVASQHEATVNELRVILGQREAAEASLARERDNLTAQNEELRRKLSSVEQDAPEVDDSTVHRLASLELQHQQAGAELSLANETVRQLNQNINHRDTELMHLRQQVQTLTQELEESQSAAAEPDESVLQEIESQHQATVNELRGLLQQQEAIAAELSSQNEALTSKVTELETAESAAVEQNAAELHEVKSQHEPVLAELRMQLADREATATELTSQVEELTAKLGEMESTAAERTAESNPNREAELSLANETVRQLNQNINQRDSQLFELRREMTALQNQFDETQSAVPETDQSTVTDDERAKFAEQLAELEEERDQIRKLLEQAQQSCAELEVDRNRHRTEFDSARERLHEELATAKEEQQTTVEELEVAKNQVNEQAHVIEKLRDDRSALQAQANSVDPSEIESLTAQRDEALGRYDKLQIDFAHAVKGNDEGSSEELEATRQKLKAKSADYDALQAELHTLKARFESETGALHSRLESVSSELASRDALPVAAVPSSETDSENTQGTVDTDSSSQIAELEAAVEQQEQYAAGLQTERQELLDQLGAAQEELDAKATEMRRMRELLEQAQEEAQVVADQKQAFTDLQATEKEISQVADTRGAELKRLQDEQIEIKQQLAHFIDAEEGWKNERISLFAQAGLDENGEPLETDDATLKVDTMATQQRIDSLEASLAERDEAIQVLNERFAELKQMYDSSDDVSVLHDDAADPTDVMRVERDQAAAAAAQASAKIAELMTEMHQLKSDQSAEQSAELAKLHEENREYRRSVAELHAAVNELEEVKLDRGREQDSSRQRLLEATRANAELSAELLEVKASIRSNAKSDESPEPQDQEALAELSRLKKQAGELQRERDDQTKAIAELKAELDATPEDRKEGAKAVRNAKRLATKLEQQEKKTRERDERLQDLAVQLSKMRTEASSLKNEVAEQQAIVRALSKGGTLPAATSDQNGRVAAKKKATTASTKKVAASRTATKKTAKKKAAGRKTPAPPKAKPAKKAAKTVTKKRPAKVDDLKEILGIGPVLEKRLNKIGIYHFAQVKAWSKATVSKLDEQLELGGRIQRDKWVAQAKKLASRKTAK